MKEKKKISIVPTAGYVLIEPKEASKKTESGIYLPETSDEKPQEGIVLAVGPDEILDNGKVRKASVKVGDKIIYKKWGGNEVKIGSKEYLFSKFEDILAIVK
ncbi:MAG TPA: co-chaperone GroES [Patescibacteria group bacterium]|nr:co-chaperone GroES [Patescibacteria group bacterium]